MACGRWFGRIENCMQWLQCTIKVWSNNRPTWSELCNVDIYHHFCNLFFPVYSHLFFFKIQICCLYNTFYLLNFTIHYLENGTIYSRLYVGQIMQRK